MASGPAPPSGWDRRSPDGRWWFDGRSWLPVPLAQKERPIPSWGMPSSTVWVVLLAAACAVELALAPRDAWLRATMLGVALLGTLGVGAVFGRHRHWRGLPLLAAAPPAVLLLTWLALWAIDPTAFAYFAFASFFVAWALAFVVYPCTLGILAAGAALGALGDKLARTHRRAGQPDAV